MKRAISTFLLSLLTAAVVFGQLPDSIPNYQFPPGVRALEAEEKLAKRKK